MPRSESSSAQPPERLGLTGLRGIAALTVVVSHARIAEVVPSFSWIEGCSGWAVPAVDLFFMLSGSVLLLRYSRPQSYQLKQYLAARVARIFPLQWFVLLLIVAMEAVWSVRRGSWDPRVSLGKGLLQAVLLHRWPLAGYTEGAWNPPSWSLSVEWFVYVFVAPPLIWLARRFVNLSGLIKYLVPLMLALLVADCLVVGAEKEMGMISWGLWRGVLGFTFGALAYAVLEKWKPSISARWPGAMLLAVLLAASANAPVEVLFLLCAALMLLTQTVDGRGGILESGFMVWLGRISYSLYLLHWPLMGFVYRCGYKNWLANQSPVVGWIGAGALIGGIVGAASLCFRWVEKPCRSQIRKALSRG